MIKNYKIILTICILVLAFTPILSSAATEGCGNINLQGMTFNQGTIDKLMKNICNGDGTCDINGKNFNIDDMLAKLKAQTGFDFQMPKNVPPTNEATTQPTQPAKATPAPAKTTPPAPAPTEQTTAPSPSGSYEKQVVDLVNQERQKAGLAPLKENAALSNVAETKAKDLRDNNYFSHTSPVYGSPFDMMKQFGIKYTAAGENIAKGQRDPQTVMNGWMNSEGHRANILNSNFTEIGVGYVTDSNGNTYWVQMFIRP